MSEDTSALFEPFPKIARLNRDCVITEKLDGTNAQVIVMGDRVYAASRSRLITPEDDNFGFARWVKEHEEELRVGLGEGRHFGEWWGSGIQRGYGLPKGEKRFSLFNISRWGEVDLRAESHKGAGPAPACCSIVPVLYSGEFTSERVASVVDFLRVAGSQAAPFMNPEGVIVWHSAARTLFKVTLEKDAEPKTARARSNSIAA